LKGLRANRCTIAPPLQQDIVAKRSRLIAARVVPLECRSTITLAAFYKTNWPVPER
jgi:hypothetical protein